MPDKRLKATVDGCLGGLVGAPLGIVIGGFVGNTMVPYGISGFFAMLLGAGLGGIIGGIGGSAFGASLSAKGSNTPAATLPARKDAGSALPPEPLLESPEAELARLKKRVAELEGMHRIKRPPKEGDLGSP
jgi:hypothetical protein